MSLKLEELTDKMSNEQVMNLVFEQYEVIKYPLFLQYL
jgi:hypothetical protein